MLKVTSAVSGDTLAIVNQAYLTCTLVDCEGSAIPLHKLRDALARWYDVHADGALRVVVMVADDTALGCHRELTLKDLR